MKGYYEGYSYVGIMPNGSKMRFATDQEYIEAWREWCQALSFYFSQHDHRLLQRGTIWFLENKLLNNFKED